MDPSPVRSPGRAGHGRSTAPGRRPGDVGADRARAQCMRPLSPLTAATDRSLAGEGPVVVLVEAHRRSGPGCLVQAGDVRLQL